MPAAWVIFVVALAVLAIGMVFALVPFSLELLEPSADAQQHRRRLADMGVIGSLSARLAPIGIASPARFWGTLYFAAWAGLMALLAWVVSQSEPKDRLKNLLICAAMPAAWFSVQFAVIAFGRAIQRANRRNPSIDVAETQDLASTGDQSEPDSPEEPASTTAANSGTGPEARLKSALSLAGMLALVLVIRVAADHLPPLHAWARFAGVHRAAMLSVVISAAAIGWLMFMGGVIGLLLGGAGRPMTHGEIERFQAQLMRLELQARARRVSGDGGFSGAVYRFEGEAVGREGQDQWTIPQMKAALRAGLWWRVPRWRRRFVTFAGAMLMTVGLFGIFIVRGPEWVMLLCSLALLYAGVRLSWAFWRA